MRRAAPLSPAHRPGAAAINRSSNGLPSRGSIRRNPQARSSRLPLDRRLLFGLLGVLLLGVIAWVSACGSGGGKGGGSAGRPGEPTLVIAVVDTSRGTPQPPTPSPTPVVTPAPLAQQLCLVTRSKGIPESYVPPDLVTLDKTAAPGGGVQMRREAADALLKLLAGARARGINLVAVSGYRSAEYQQSVLDQEIKQYGAAKAHSEVADPGHSEHQLGDAVDVLSASDPVDLDDRFGTTPEGQWLYQNAPQYGFMVSYPQGKEAITGYIYEPWHIRYLGLPLAQQVYTSGLTITEYLPQHGLDGCPLQYGELAATATPLPPLARPPGR